MSAASLAGALLNHSAAAPATHTGSRLPQNKQMIVLEGSLAQSTASVVREMVLRNETR